MPVTKSWSQLIEEAGGKPPKDLKDTPVSTRASMDGQVPGKITYDEWLRGQPVANQKEVLGDTKYELFAEGKLKVQDMVDTTSGKPLTIKALLAKAGEPAPPVQAAAPALGPVPVVPTPSAPPKPTKAPPVATSGPTARPPEGPPPSPPAPKAPPTPAGITGSLDDVTPWPKVSSMGWSDSDRAATAYKEAFEKEYNQHEAASPPQGREALSDYVGVAYSSMNKYHRSPDELREGTADRPGRWNEIKRQVDALQEFILKARPTKFNMVVFRGDKIRFKAGEIETVKGFTSTTTHPKIAYDFGYQESPTLYEIFIPAGSRGVLSGFNQGEMELLLAHGAKFRVLSEREVELPAGKHRGGQKTITVQRLEYLGV